MQAIKVSDGFTNIFCETEEDAELVRKELWFGAFASGRKSDITILPVEVETIPEVDRNYLKWLRGEPDAN